MDQKLESSLRISNIQSLQEVKKEKEELDSSTIKVKSISEINQTAKSIMITKQHPSQQIISKHIVVKRLPNSPSGSSICLSPVNATNGTKVLKASEQMPKAMGNFSIPPVLEAYIKDIEDQNKELKKVLTECRREVLSIQMRTHKLSNIINSTISRCNTKRPINAMKQAMAMPPQYQKIVVQPPVQQKSFKILPKKSNNITAKGNIVCRVPVFPITRLQILKQLEIDLSKKEFSEYVFQKLYTVNNKTDIDKPSVLLNNTLNSIIDPKLMGLFSYEESLDSNDTEAEFFKSMQRIRVLYGKLVNALSNNIFTKSVDMVALEKFVKNKISSHRSEYLANQERLNKSKAAEISTATIKTEQLDTDDKCINVEDSQLRWLDDDEPMHTAEG